ncbi:MAG: DUF5606 domain-containing protein [Bacteroidetes bacterium]|nr:DUF5606 domain-containing protein [Bacteroidota bacterium]HET6245247.1 DUF5606 domain-containing protein [Bacteroidia bacterium]
MNLSDYISVSGQGGLFKIISKANNGLIVESLTEKKRLQVHASQKVSSLQDISIFTTNEDVPLIEVFTKIFEKEKGGAAIDSKSDAEALKKYFDKVLPEYDKDRVYVSDIKKVISWYNILQADGLIKPVVEEKSTEKEAEDTDKPKKTKAESKDKAEATAKRAAKTVKPTPKTSKAKTGKTQTVRKTGA